MIFGKPYQRPPAPWKPGDKVRFYLEDDLIYRGFYEVKAADHCFTWLDEFPHQISNWRLKKVQPRKRQKVEA